MGKGKSIPPARQELARAKVRAELGGVTELADADGLERHDAADADAEEGDEEIEQPFLRRIGDDATVEAREGQPRPKGHERREDEREDGDVETPDGVAGSSNGDAADARDTAPRAILSASLLSHRERTRRHRPLLA